MKLTPIKTLVVYRDLWLRGGDPDTGLLNEHGMCCLGFACLAMGVDAADMHGVKNPEDIAIDDDIPNFAYREYGHRFGTHAGHKAIGLNDNPAVTDAERERSLTVAFDLFTPIALTFEDTAPPELRAQYEAGLK